MLGLPALVRAVPARLFQRPPRLRPRVWPSPGTTLLKLVTDLSPEVRKQALTHSSWAEARAQSNERLEFLGDSVLGLAIASMLWRRYPESEEGDLARLKAFIVSRASCAEVAERLGVWDLMAGEMPPTRGEVAHSRAMLGNALEALIGAVFLTFGFEQARLAVVDAFEEEIHHAATTHVDHKTALQELLAPRGLQPEYRLTDESGPAHARVFNSEVSVGGVAHGQGSGTTIKMSEQAAAKEALASLAGTTEVG